MARTLKAKKPLACGGCGHTPLRMRLMLYDDAEGALNLISDSCQGSLGDGTACLFCEYASTDKCAMSRSQQRLLGIKSTQDTAAHEI